MKNDIHPKYGQATITCGCGNSWETRSTKSELHIEICSQCHPFFTGEQRIVDTAGRVERFRRRYGITENTDDTSLPLEEISESEEPTEPTLIVENDS